MPICPRCNATIHTGAREQCPACGYSLTQIERVFGTPDVTFPRVKDVAGVLTQQERENLMRYLANLERHIPPVALCVYLTNHGQSQDFRAHAHWILNHAHIHTPSFGQRESKRAIEDAELRELAPGETKKMEPDELQEEGALTRFRHWLRDGYQARFAKCPPPVRQEWMLILVVDVQLKMACFSWGYMLDPYINPDKINSCITAARLQFRERARVAALEIVMKKAARQLAANARKINRDISKGKRLVSPLLTALFGFSLLAASPVCWAAKAPAKPAKPAATQPAKPAKPASKPAPAKAKAVVKEDDLVAIDDDEPVAIDDDEPVAIDDEAEGTPATPPPATTPPPAPKPAAAPEADTPGSPASYKSAPVWQKRDTELLREGKLSTSYRMLLPGGAVRTDTAAKPKSTGEESDKDVGRRYCEEYNRPSETGLADPQGLLSDPERTDVIYALAELNSGKPFHVYVAVFKDTQTIPQELNANVLVSTIAQADSYAALILYSIGDTPGVQVGYKEIAPTDDQRRDWLRRTQDAAAQAGGGVDGLLATARCLQGCILPVSKDFRPISADGIGKLPHVPLEFEKKDGEKKLSFSQKMKAWLDDPEHQGTMANIGIAAAGALLVGLLFAVRRRTVRLMDTKPDVRLSSPYGAGVSRYVRYLDGKEAAKEPTLF